MKLVDTYTNVCFLSLVYYQRDSIAIYLLIITALVVVMYILFKAMLTIYFIGYTLVKLKGISNSSSQES